MSKIIIKGEDAKKKLMNGISELADSVKVTLGPRGKNVIIDDQFSDPRITKDGVSVAKSIELKDEVENLGANLLKKVAIKTNDEAGDGTTTATILAEAILKEGYKYLNKGFNAAQIKLGITLATEAVIKELRASSVNITIDDADKIHQIATISANGDEKVGDYIYEALRVAKDRGLVTIENSSSTITEVTTSVGMKFNRGFISPYFMNNVEKSNCYYEDPYILVVAKDISTIDPLKMPLMAAQQASRPLLIIANDISGQALQMLVLNKVKANFPVVAIKAPGFAEIRREYLYDIAARVGATCIDEELGVDIRAFQNTWLGTCKSVTITDSDTIIVTDGSNIDSVEERVLKIKKQLENEKQDYVKDQLQDRLANLTGEAATIKVGATSEVELGELKDRIEDALNAAKSALAEGIVSGGGVALLKASALANSKKPVDLSKDAQIGWEAVIASCTAPIKQLCYNADQSADLIISHIEMTEYDTVFNFNTLEFTTSESIGLYDPLKVTRSALESASAIAGIILTTDRVVTTIVDKE